MRIALLAVLLATFAQAHAQKGVLVTPLPEGMDNQSILQVARQVLTARGWALVPEDDNTIEAKKDRSGLRIYVGEKALRYSDESVGRRARQRNREEGPQFAAVPPHLPAAFAGKPPVVGLTPPPPRAPGQILVSLPAGADPQRVMEAAYSAFAGRKWAVSRDADGAVVARNRNFDIDATLRVFIGDGALRYIDGTLNRKGGKGQVPERWLNYLRADLNRTIGALLREERRAAPPATANPGDATGRLRRPRAPPDR